MAKFGGPKQCLQLRCCYNDCLLVRQDPKNLKFFVREGREKLCPNDFATHENFAHLEHSPASKMKSDARTVELEEMTRLVECYGLMYSFDLVLPSSKQVLRQLSLAPELQLEIKNRSLLHYMSKEVVKEVVSPQLEALRDQDEEIQGSIDNNMLVNSFELHQIVKGNSRKLDKLLKSKNEEDLFDYKTAWYKLENFLKNRKCDLSILGTDDFLFVCDGKGYNSTHTTTSSTPVPTSTTITSTTAVMTTQVTTTTTASSLTRILNEKGFESPLIACCLCNFELEYLQYPFQLFLVSCYQMVKFDKDLIFHPNRKHIHSHTDQLKKLRVIYWEQLHSR